MSQFGRKLNVKIQPQNINLRRRKQEIKKNIYDVETMLSSNKSAISMEQFNYLKQTNNEIGPTNCEDIQTHRNINNWSFLNETIRKIDTKPSISMKLIPSGTYSLKCLEPRLLRTNNTRYTDNRSRCSISCQSKERRKMLTSRTSVNPHREIQKIKQQRLKKTKQLDEIQSQISLLSKTTKKKEGSKLRQQNNELRRKLSQYCSVVEQFSQFINSPKHKNYQSIDVRDKWQSLMNNIN